MRLGEVLPDHQVVEDLPKYVVKELFTKKAITSKRVIEKRCID